MNFSGLTFNNANWVGSALANANLDRVIATRTNFDRMKANRLCMNHARADYVSAKDAQVWSAHMTYNNFDDSYFAGANFTDVNIFGRTVRYTNVGRVDFIRAFGHTMEFFEACLRNARFYGANLYNSSFKGPQWRGAIVDEYAAFQSCNFLNATELRDASTSDVADFDGAILDSDLRDLSWAHGPGDRPGSKPLSKEPWCD